MPGNEKYEAVIGLEIHAQLSTTSKLFCGDSLGSGEAPNTQVSVISLGHPGTLPRTNKKAVEYAVKMGLACNCDIQLNSFFARKNYFYPDLPKGYQVSQHTVPVCKGGYVTIKVNGDEKRVILDRIHLEEDAGKSIHDSDDAYSLIDYNRAGTPLIEIVTEPCIHSAEEAYQYLVTVRKLVKWLDICDGNMEKGNLRCDANISLRKKGSKTLGTKAEVKNLNSTRNLKKAIEVEIERMTGLLEQGKKIQQQTRSFDASTDTTFALRDKEEANDYRYFPDPDIAPVIIELAFIEALQTSLPPLPAQLEKKYIDAGLSAYDAVQLTSERETSELFEILTRYVNDYKAVANWIIGPIRQQLNEGNVTHGKLHASVKKIGELILLAESGKISFAAASTKVFAEMMLTGKAPMQIITEQDLGLSDNTDELNKWVDTALANLPDKVAEYRKGKKALIGLFVGEVKKLSKGKADPKLVNDLLQQKLNNN
jgi:aspartyl-tRNA(Asn)/glutamyl-tRNA(Gln) amidotransferase subunit B